MSVTVLYLEGGAVFFGHTVNGLLRACYEETTKTGLMSHNGSKVRKTFNGGRRFDFRCISSLV